MKEFATLGLIWLAMFYALSRAARYPLLWAAIGASATTGVVGIYVFWVDWRPLLH